MEGGYSIGERSSEMHDYKYEMQMLAEETAEEVYGKGFYELSQEEQYRVFRGAEEDWVEKMQGSADGREDRW